MTADFPTNSNPMPMGQAPRKKGCGCCGTGCLAFLVILFLVVVGAGAALWFGAKNATVPDAAILFTYEKVIRPQVVENLPPNMSEAQKQQVLDASDFGVKRFLELPDERKNALLKEVLIASYYYSQKQVIPPEKIPNLTQFVQETMKVYQGR